MCLTTPANNGTNKLLFVCFGFFSYCSALTHANITVQIAHEGPAEAGGCFLDLRPLSLRKDLVSSPELREGIFHLYGRKEEEE